MKIYPKIGLILLLGLTFTSCLNEQSNAPASINPIVEISGMSPTDKAFSDSKADKPIRLVSLAHAAPYLTQPLTAKVDFENQYLLLFAWKGSGRDEIDFDVAESFPEQIQFGYRRGMTKDYRPHLRLFALRKGVTYSVAK